MRLVFLLIQASNVHDISIDRLSLPSPPSGNTWFSKDASFLLPSSSWRCYACRWIEEFSSGSSKLALVIFHLSASILTTNNWSEGNRWINQWLLSVAKGLVEVVIYWVSFGIETFKTESFTRGRDIWFKKAFVKFWRVVLSVRAFDGCFMILPIGWLNEVLRIHCG